MGCNEEMETIQPDKDFTVDNGMLSFKSSETFYKTLSLLDSMSNEEMETWLVDLGFHNSLYFKFKEMKDCGEYFADGSTLTPQDVCDRSFAALLNSEGLLSVGDTISFVQKNVENVITNGDFSMVKKIKESPEKEFENVIKNYPHSNLKASWGQVKLLQYKSTNLFVECEFWLEIWFWTHSSYTEIDLVSGSSPLDLDRVLMDYSLMEGFGRFASDDDGIDPEYVNRFNYNSTGTAWVNSEQIYRCNGQSGWLCSKDVRVNARVRKNGDSTYDSKVFYFNAAQCVYSGF